MLKRWLQHYWLGGSLLLVAFVIGLATMFWGTFPDEGDNLAVGLMLSRGSVLYRDIFSHHFPFAYYWTAIITGLFGSSIAAARISILFFQIGSFAWSMYLTRYIIPVGSVGILWSIVGPFFFSNFVLYTGFTSTALLVIFIITIAALSNRIVVGRKELLTLGIFATIAVLSDPLAIYPVLCVLIFLALSSARFKRACLVGAFPVMALGLYGLYLLASGSAEAFYRDVIQFNVEIYNRYVFAQPLRITNILSLAGNALNLAGQSWQSDPFMPLQRAQLNSWLFAGFLFRVTILLTAVISLLRRRFVLAGFVYLYPVTLLAMNQDTFRLMPFALIAGFAGMWLIFADLDGAVMSRKRLDEADIKGRAKQLALNFPSRLARCLIGGGFAWLLLRSVDTLAQSRQQFSYESSWGYHIVLADYIRNDLACGQTDVSLAYYPGEPTFNYLTGLPPVSKYFYLFPWVAEVAQSEVVRSLSTGKAIVYVDWRSSLWDQYTAETYLAPLKIYLENNYLAAGQGFYVSPDLARECHFTRFYPQVFLPAQIPDGEVIPGRKYFQTFTSECAGLNFFEIYPATFGRTITSTLSVRLKDLEADQQLFDQTIQGTTVMDSRWHRVTFDALPDSKGRQYRISLASSDAQPGNAFGLWRTATDVYTGGEASINDRPLQADLVFRYGCQP